MVDFASGFAQGFSQAKTRKQEREQVEEFKKAQVKLVKSQLDALDKQNELTRQQMGARQELFAQFQPSSAPLPGTEGPPESLAPGKTLTEILSDPEGQLAAIKSGLFTAKDIGLEKERSQFGELMKQLQSGGQVADVDPLSLLAATQTRDISQLKPVETEQVTVQTDEGPRIQVKEKRTGKLVADLGPAKEEKVTPEQAGKVTSIKFAKEQLQKAIDIISPKGVLDQSLVFQLSLPVKVGAAREAEQLIKEAIATKVLIQSGVTAREDEVKATMERFVPNAFDLTRPNLAERKLENLKAFMEGAIDLVTLPPSLVKRIKEQKGDGGEPVAKKFRFNPETGQLEPK